MSIEIISSVPPGNDDLSLTPEEDRILWLIWRRRTLFVLSAFFALVTVLSIVLLNLFGKTYTKRGVEIPRIYAVSIVFFCFLFIVLLVFFLRYYFKSAHPFYKDRKRKSKEIIYLEPHCYKAPYFESYYLIIPIQNRKHISISKGMYDALEESRVAQIIISHHAKFVFSIRAGDQVVLFDEKHSPME